MSECKSTGRRATSSKCEWIWESVSQWMGEGVLTSMSECKSTGRRATSSECERVRARSSARECKWFLATVSKYELSCGEPRLAKLRSLSYIFVATAWVYLQTVCRGKLRNLPFSANNCRTVISCHNAVQVHQCYYQWIAHIWLPISGSYKLTSYLAPFLRYHWLLVKFFAADSLGTPVYHICFNCLGEALNLLPENLM